MTNFYVFYVCIYILFQLLFHHSIAHTVCTRRVSSWCRLTARDSRERQRGKLHIKFYNLRAREGHFACVKHFQAKWTGTEKKISKVNKSARDPTEAEGRSSTNCNGDFYRRERRGNVISPCVLCLHHPIHLDAHKKNCNERAGGKSKQINNLSQLVSTTQTKKKKECA